MMQSLESTKRVVYIVNMVKEYISDVCIYNNRVLYHPLISEL